MNREIAKKRAEELVKKMTLEEMASQLRYDAPGIPRLPRIGIVDIGPSSSGLISLLKESLPLDKKHLAQYYRIRMTEDYCVNPFDTQLGCRFPTAEEVAFLNNFLLLLVTDPNKETPEEGMVGLVQEIINDMYHKCSDKGSAKRYDVGVDANNYYPVSLRYIRSYFADSVRLHETGIL